MTSAYVRFESSTLSSLERTRYFLNFDSELTAINQFADLERNGTFPLEKGFNQNRITRIKREACFECFIAVYFWLLLKVFSFLSNYISSSRFENSRRISEVNYCAKTKNFQILTYHSRYGDKYLASSTNFYSTESSDIYLQPSIPVSMLDNHLTAPLLDNWKKNSIDFFSEGLCYGTSVSFLSLFLKTQDKFQDLDNQMISICKQFENGGSNKVGVIQSLWYNRYRSEHLLGIAKEYSSKISFKDKNVYVPEGSYLIRLSSPAHACAYIKMNENLAYIFEPNVGVLKIQTENGKTVDDQFKGFIQDFWGTDFDPSKKVIFESVKNVLV